MLIGIVLLAAFFRLWTLGSGDTLTDEVLYSFRAIGMLDFDEAAEQTTPLEWFDPHIPAWTNLSFHDHPPLVFAVQHVFIRILGETPFAFRFPSALLGTASVYLLYLIGARLYGKNTGLLAAGLFTVTVNHIAISRLGLQEAYSIFFILLGIYFFLKAAENPRHYISTGITLGLALLTKYTAGIFIPIILTYMALFRQHDFRQKHVWVGMLLAVIIFSPVLIYNFQLYQAAGHFDFQLSYIIGQNPEIWQIAPGKEEFPTITSRLSAFLPNILKFNSWVFLFLFGGSIMAFGVSLIKNRRGTAQNHAFLLTSVIWLLLLIIGFIGPSMRFLAMLTPFMALASAVFVMALVRKFDFCMSEVRLPHIILIFIFLFEFGYSINSQIISYPKGPGLWAWSSVRYENYNWGYQELDKWMRSKTDGRMPALAFEPTYHFIGKIHQQALGAAERKGNKPYPALFVYDKNIQSIAQLWTLDRLQIYHAWPVIPADTYQQFLADNGTDYFARVGFKEIYYIFPTQHVPWKKTHLTSIGVELEQTLRENGLDPYTILENKRSEPVFRIYREEIP